MAGGGPADSFGDPPIPTRFTSFGDALATLRSLVLLAGAAMLAQPASAQSLKVPAVVFAAAATTDWISTAEALSTGAHEQNPLIAWAKQPAPIIAAGAGIDAALVWAAVRWGPHHPRLARALLYGGAAVRLTLATRNFELAQRRRADIRRYW